MAKKKVSPLKGRKLPPGMVKRMIEGKRRAAAARLQVTGVEFTDARGVPVDFPLDAVPDRPRSRPARVATAARTDARKLDTARLIAQLLLKALE